jgi:hypothetical protein
MKMPETKLPTLFYYVLMVCKKDPAKPYVIGGEDCMHETIDGAIQEASAFNGEKDYDLIALEQVNIETGEPKRIYDAGALEDSIRQWQFDQLSEEEQRQQRKDEADIARWEEKHDCGEA